MIGKAKTFGDRLAALRWPGWLGVAVWAGVLFALSARSTLPPGPPIPYQDKVLHFLYFSGGGFCFALAILGWRRPALPAWRWWLTGTLFGMVAGALDEYHQTFTPGRSGNDVGDWLADWTGAGAGALIACILLAWARRGQTKAL
ncbi:MAG TPA: VanZ family protein [Prosthecobacter sp.]